tara:strand:- start:222 stop:869 length:648 start_codon:yes stop_codon:yes gene_type:complete
MNLKIDNLKDNSKIGSRRSEIKYDITNFSEEFFISKFKLKEIYQKRKITSIYYDTKYLDFYNLSQEGILPRKKVRIRFYNIGEYNLEIKSQDFYSKIKKIIKLKNIEDLNYHLLDNGITQQLKPKINVNFIRRYFLSTVGRITIDRDINYSICNSGSIFEIRNKIISNQKILEIKYENINDKIPVSFRGIELKEQRNSKYCNGIDLLYKKLYPYL